MLLSITALAAIVITYLLGLTVMGDTDMASKFENGAAPPGTAVALALVAALDAWTGTGLRAAERRNSLGLPNTFRIAWRHGHNRAPHHHAPLLGPEQALSRGVRRG